MRHRPVLLLPGGGGGGGGLSDAPSDGTKYGRQSGAWVAINDGYIDGEVDVHADLPVVVGTPALDSAYLVHTASGLWLINRKPAGIWIRTGNAGTLDDWTYAGTFADVYSDANFSLYDDGDTTKELGFSLGGITTGTKRIWTAPDKNGTVAMTSDIPAAANPSGSVGLAAVNGAASTFMRSDGAPALDQAIAPSWTGAHDFSGSGGKLKLPNTTAPSAEGQVNWDQTLKSLGAHNGQTILMDDVGWLPYAFGLGTTTTSTQTGTLTLASGSGVAIPVLVPTHMRIQSVGWRNMDTGSTRDVEFRVYRQRLNNGNSGENSVDEVTGCSGSESFIPGGSASNRAPNVSTPGTYLPPGLYWLVIRNQGANSYGFATVAVTGSLSKSVYQTKAIGALGSTIDLIAATWTKGTQPVIVTFNGRILGDTAAY